MTGRRLPRLISLNRRFSWLLVVVSVVVLLMGYSLTVLDVEGPLADWGHRALGGVFGVLFMSHMLVSVVLVRYGWREALARLRAGSIGLLGWLRIAQRASGWVVAVFAFLVLASGLDWFKLGTGWLFPFSSHVRVDVFLSLSVAVHAGVGLYFALMRRNLGRKREGSRESVFLARREAIVLLGGMFVSVMATLYLDKIPRVSNVVDRVRGILPPGQYEVANLRPLHYGVVPPFDEESWTLKIEGLVRKSVTLSYEEVRALPRVVSVSDFHCVTGWTKFGNRWEGVSFKTIMRMVRPKAGARHALIVCEATYPMRPGNELRGREGIPYTTSLPLEDLDREDVLLVYRLDNAELPREFGGPLRLVVPHKYGYKSAKWVREVRFVAEGELGFWESGGYSDVADPWTEDRYSGRG